MLKKIQSQEHNFSETTLKTPSEIPKCDHLEMINCHSTSAEPAGKRSRENKHSHTLGWLNEPRNQTEAYVKKKL